MNATILDLGRRLKQRERLAQRLAPLAVGPAPDDRDEATAAPLPHWLRLRLDRADLMLSRRADAFAASAVAAMTIAGAMRSEEHTSELQSLMRISYAVFCLKKKNKT